MRRPAATAGGRAAMHNDRFQDCRCFCCCCRHFCPLSGAGISAQCRQNRRRGAVPAWRCGRAFPSGRPGACVAAHSGCPPVERPAAPKRTALLLLPLLLLLLRRLLQRMRFSHVCAALSAGAMPRRKPDRHPLCPCAVTFLACAAACNRQDRRLCCGQCRLVRFVRRSLQPPRQTACNGHCDRHGGPAVRRS